MKSILQIITIFSFSQLALAINFNANVTKNEIATFESNRLVLSLTNYNDQESLDALCHKNIHGHYMDSLFTCWVEWDEDLIQDYITSMLEDNLQVYHSNNSFNSLAYSIRLKENNEIIGTFNIVHSSEGEISLGIFIGQDHKKKGYATEVVTAALLFIKEKSFATKCIKWECWEKNMASQKIATKCQFDETVERVTQKKGPPLLIYRKNLR